MKIERIYYLEIPWHGYYFFWKDNKRDTKRFAEKIAERVGVKEVNPYVVDYCGDFQPKPKSKLPILEPRSLLVGNSNWYHHIAYYLSKRPLVNIDYHLDSFDHIDEETKQPVLKKGNLTDANWVYWVLKSGRKVHSVLPEISHFHIEASNETTNGAVIPADALEKLKVYPLKRNESNLKMRIGNYRNKELHTVEAADMGDLKEIKDVEKQISIDLDFIARKMSGVYKDAYLMPGIPKKELKRIVSLCIGENDVVDVWPEIEKPAALIAELLS